MKLSRLSAADVQPAQPLGCDIFSADGKLLLARGQRIGTEAQARRLLDTAFRRCPSSADAGATVFSRMHAIATRLATLQTECVRRIALGTWARRLNKLVDDLLLAADEDPDAAFAMPHLDTHFGYDVLHHLMAALTAARLARAVGLDDASVRSLAAAAITHDIAVLAHRQELDAAEILSEAQRERITHHPVAGAAMLRELGIDDALWLEAVAQHHEYLDGSGYPEGFNAEALAIGSRIIALADALSAMLRVRPYRERRLAKEALAELYADTPGRYDKALVAALVSELGVYPPGSVVRLESRHIAIVTRNVRSDCYRPQLVAIAAANGRPLYRPVALEHDRPGADIVAVLNPEITTRIHRQLASCWALQ